MGMAYVYIAQHNKINNSFIEKSAVEFGKLAKIPGYLLFLYWKKYI